MEKFTISSQQVSELRSLLGDVEMARFVGIGFRNHHCIGKENGCVRKGECSKHGWTQSYFIGDDIDVSRGQNAYKARVPLRYWNFLVALKNAKDYRKAVAWVKEKAFIGKREPMRIDSTLGFKTYGQMFNQLGIEP